VPDVHLVWDGIPIWLELKVSKGNAVNISPHQIAWHMAYHARGGLSFYLVKRSKDRDILLFGGDQGPMVLDLGCLAPCALIFFTVRLRRQKEKGTESRGPWSPRLVSVARLRLTSTT